MVPAILSKASFKTALKWAVVALVVYVLYRGLKKGAGAVSDAVSNLFGGNVSDVADNAVPEDGTTLDGDFDPQATAIADGQYSAMSVSGTDENSLFVPLLNLNGAQLVKVFEQFGVKEGKNLFQWYGSELSNNMFTSLSWHDESVPGCSTYIDGCYEKDFMRAIWQKSGLPITF